MDKKPIKLSDNNWVRREERSVRPALEPLKRNHGMVGTRFYNTWSNMVQRATNERSDKYSNYGGRGIKVDKIWRDFRNFFIDMYPSFRDAEEEFGKGSVTIDRIDNDKGYFKDNCRWVRMHEQGNNRRANRVILYKGREKNLCEWAKEIGIKPGTLANRLKVMSVEDAFNKPVKHSCGSHKVDSAASINGHSIDDIMQYSKEYGDRRDFLRFIASRFGVPKVAWPEGYDLDEIYPTEQLYAEGYNQGRADAIAAYERARKGEG